MVNLLSGVAKMISNYIGMCVAKLFNEADQIRIHCVVEGIQTETPLWSDMHATRLRMFANKYVTRM